jgi:hypothetical protein
MLSYSVLFGDSDRHPTLRRVVEDDVLARPENLHLFFSCVQISRSLKQAYASVGFGTEDVEGCGMDTNAYTAYESSLSIKVSRRVDSVFPDYHANSSFHDSL